MGLPTRRNIIALALTIILSIIVTPGFASDTDVTALFNEIRTSRGLGHMIPDSKLEQAAIYQAKRMAQYQKMGHSIGWGNGFVARLRKAGIHGAAAENVASGQPDYKTVFKAWMNSSGHRRNMLDPAFSHYGIAWATSEEKPGYRYWALVLGR